MVERRPEADGDKTPVSAPEARPGKRVSRRVTRPAPEGVDPTPQSSGDVVKAAEDSDQAWGEGPLGNDADLKLNKPPHWG